MSLIGLGDQTVSEGIQESTGADVSLGRGDVSWVGGCGIDKPARE